MSKYTLPAAILTLAALFQSNTASADCGVWGEDEINSGHYIALSSTALEEINITGGNKAYLENFIGELDCHIVNLSDEQSDKISRLTALDINVEMNSPRPGVTMEAEISNTEITLRLNPFSTDEERLTGVTSLLDKVANMVESGGDYTGIYSLGSGVMKYSSQQGASNTPQQTP